MIRFTNKYLKPVALFLVVVFLFQSCKIYHKESVSIEQAIGPDKKRIRVITYDDREFVFDSIYYKNDSLYGHLWKKDATDFLIREKSIKEIHLYDAGNSTALTIALI